MKKGPIVLAAAALVVGFTSPSLATHERGEVKEIIIKIQTEEGERFYRVGSDVELLNLRPGDTVDFDYSDDDVLESIEVEEDAKEPKPTTEE